MEKFIPGTGGKVVAITGASGGRGEATALPLAERIAAAGGEAASARTDVKRRDDLSDLIKLACERYGIAAAPPVSRKQGFGHFVNTASTAGLIVKPTMAVYSGTKFAVRAISEGLRQEAGDKLRVTIISPGFINTDFMGAVTNPQVKAQLEASRDKFAIPPEAIARAIGVAVEQPADVDGGEIVVRP